jgi:hypothetical protein
MPNCLIIQYSSVFKLFIFTVIFAHLSFLYIHTWMKIGGNKYFVDILHLTTMPIFFKCNAQSTKVWKKQYSVPPLNRMLFCDITFPIKL